jgi:hypothetical protein
MKKLNTLQTGAKVRIVVGKSSGVVGEIVQHLACDHYQVRIDTGVFEDYHINDLVLQKKTLVAGQKIDLSGLGTCRLSNATTVVIPDKIVTRADFLKVVARNNYVLTGPNTIKNPVTR